MPTYSRWLFGLAAAANLAVAAWILFARGRFVQLFDLDPITGTNIVLTNLAAVLIAGFGYGYVRIALDPVRFRPLVHIGALGKLAAVAVAVSAVVWDRGAMRLAILVSGDLVFAALFVDYLRRT